MDRRSVLGATAAIFGVGGAAYFALENNPPTPGPLESITIRSFSPRETELHEEDAPIIRIGEENMVSVSGCFYVPDGDYQAEVAQVSFDEVENRIAITIRPHKPIPSYFDIESDRVDAFFGNGYEVTAVFSDIPNSIVVHEIDSMNQTRTSSVST
jgi:hypothetical protein